MKQINTDPVWIEKIDFSLMRRVFPFLRLNDGEPLSLQMLSGLLNRTGILQQIADVLDSWPPVLSVHQGEIGPAVSTATASAKRIVPSRSRN